MNSLFFNDTLKGAPARIAPAQGPAACRLDKNEQPEDLSRALKQQVLERLLDTDWNRYPGADLSDIETSVARYCGLCPENIVLGPGSAAIITTLLNYFALNNKQIVIAQPGYTLFDYHCNTYNIAYEPWYLSADLEYDCEQLPALRPGSVLLLTTPNNPVGNSIRQEQLEQILAAHPGTLVVVDAVYAEFTDMDLAPLVGQYPNLIVLRSFSKAFPVAGLRLGYLCAEPQTAAILRKLMLQFSINHFTQVFAREVLFRPELLEASRRRVQAIVEERERLYRCLQQRLDGRVLKVFRSAGNFLLLRIFDDAAFARLLSDLAQHGVQVLNTSPFPLLRNTFRASVGSAAENDFFLHCLLRSLGPQALRQPIQLKQFKGFRPLTGAEQFQLANN